MLCYAVLCCAVLCCAVLCCAVLCCAVLCCAVLCTQMADAESKLTQIMPDRTALSAEMLSIKAAVLSGKLCKELAIIKEHVCSASSLHVRPHVVLHVPTALVTNRQAAACRSASTAGRGEPAADRLTGQGPWQHSQGHLLHMASHTFVRIGRYHDGVMSNVRAFEADMNDSEHCRAPYLPEHNLEMLIYAATLGGEVELLPCDCQPLHD